MNFLSSAIAGQNNYPGEHFGFALPLVTRAGTEVQIKEALSRKPGAQLRFEDMVDESIVRELEKSGFIDKVYKQ